MKLLRTLHADLRDRQIFPAVVLLAVLAVAIPIGASIELSKVSAPPPVSIVEPHVVLPKGLATPTHELAAMIATPTSSYSTLARRGSEPDPFRQAGSSSAGSGGAPASSPKSTSTTSTTTSTSVTSTPTSTPAPTAPTTTTPKATKPSSGGSTTTPAPTAVASPTSGPATLKATEAYSVNIDTKDANGTHALTDVVRLAPLPAAQSPELIYLGVLKGGQKAAFLFTDTVKVSSASGSKLTCLPSADACQIVELSPGQGMTLAPTSNTALIASFTFELMSIGVSTYPSADAALQARDAVSTAGQTLIPLSNSTELATLRFEDKLGALVQQTPSTSGSTGTTGSTGSTATTGSPSGSPTSTMTTRASGTARTATRTGSSTPAA